MVQRLLSWAGGWMQSAYWSRTYQRYRQQHPIDETFRFTGHGTQLVGDHPITLGPRSYISQWCTLAAYGGPITIGADCRVSHNVGIWTAVDGPSGPRQGPVVIGDRVLVGYNAYISPGVTIGDDAAIGANAIVYQDVPPRSVVKTVVAYETPVDQERL
jgi:acetyltransferase-like isoleucine patch superfamily enzyme